MANKVVESVKVQSCQNQGDGVNLAGSSVSDVNMAAQDLKIEDDSWRIICLNMGCGSDKTTVGERRPTAELVLESEFPDIVFAQEIPGENVYGWKLHIPRHFYTTKGSKEAGFVWDTERLEKCREFDAGKKSDVIASMRLQRTRSGVPKWSDDALANISTRSCVVHFRQKDARAGACNDVIAVSWHGEWRQKRGVRVESFQALQYFALLIRRKHFNEARSKPPIVIGGDFNLAIEDEGLHDDFVLASYPPSTRRDERVGDETIDFFLHTKDVSVKDIAPLEMTLDESSSFTEEELGSLPTGRYLGKGEHQEELLRRQIESMDHDPVKAYLVFREFGTSFEYVRSPLNESRPTVLVQKQMEYSLPKYELTYDDKTVKRNYVRCVTVEPKSAEKYQGVSKKSSQEKLHCSKQTNENEHTTLVPKQPDCPGQNNQETPVVDTAVKRKSVRNVQAISKFAQGQSIVPQEKEGDQITDQTHDQKRLRSTINQKDLKKVHVDSQGATALNGDHTASVWMVIVLGILFPTLLVLLWRYVVKS